MQQYGLTAQEAMDYIVVGTQNGLDKTNELGDNLSEYAGNSHRRDILLLNTSSFWTMA